MSREIGTRKQFYNGATLHISLPVLLLDCPACGFCHLAAYTAWWTIQQHYSSAVSEILPEQQAASGPILIYITEI